MEGGACRFNGGICLFQVTPGRCLLEISGLALFISFRSEMRAKVFASLRVAICDKPAAVEKPPAATGDVNA